jgi:hypothetical protein
MTFLYSRATLAASILAICAACVTLYTIVDRYDDRHRVAAAEMDFAFDVSDERQLVGDADNVFVGRVVDEVGAEEIPLLPSDTDAAPGSPRTQFSVEVERNVKGMLRGTVTVSQEGGYIDYVADRGSEKGNRLQSLVIYEGDRLLESGQRYLFVTSFDQGKGYHQVTTPGYGDVPIGRGAGEKALEPLVEKFERAENQQIDPEQTDVPPASVPPVFSTGDDVPDDTDLAGDGAL